MSLEMLVSLRCSLPWCASWFLRWTKDLSQPILKSLPSLQLLFIFLFTHGTSLTYYSCVCKLWNNRWLKVLEFFYCLFFAHCVWVFGLQVFVGCRCFSSSNFSVSSVASRCCLSTLSLSLAIALFLSLPGHHSLSLSPLCSTFFFFPSHRSFSFSLVLKLSLSCVEAFFLSPWHWHLLYLSLELKLSPFLL